MKLPSCIDALGSSYEKKPVMVIGWKGFPEEEVGRGLSFLLASCGKIAHTHFQARLSSGELFAGFDQLFPMRIDVRLLGESLNFIVKSLLDRDALIQEF